MANLTHCVPVWIRTPSARAAVDLLKALATRWAVVQVAPAVFLVAPNVPAVVANAPGALAAPLTKASIVNRP